MRDGSVRFGRFEFSPANGELLRAGVPVKLQRQPARVLSLLVSRAGAIVTRDELQREVWGAGTHVDFERGLNFCVAQIRTALGDSAESPRYLETVPKQGYRFIAPVTAGASSVGAVFAPPADAGSTGAAFSRPTSTLYRNLALLAAVAAVVAIGLTLKRALADPPTVVVIPFYNETGVKDFDTVAAGLGDGVVARLATPGRARQVAVIGNAPVLRNPFARKDVQEIGRTLGAEYLVVGQLKTDGERLRLIAHFIRVSDMKHLWAQTYDDERFALEAQGRTSEAVAGAVTGSLTP